MQRSLFVFLLLNILLFCFSQEQPGNKAMDFRKAWQVADKYYRQAELLSAQAGDNDILLGKADDAYRQALAAFTGIRPTAGELHADSILYLLYSRSGFIHYYFDSTAAAKQDYLAAIALRPKLPALADSLLFLPYLYTGGIYYGDNEFDSALNFYKKAEAINHSYKKPLNGAERLYNRLGVMYYETGNYRQARNYFEKAITLTDPADKNLLVNYKINIASILVKLEEFDEARSVYESILPYNVFIDEIYHNLAITSLEQKDYKKAISFLQKVNYTDLKKNIDLFYNFSVAYAGLSENDSSELYMQRALTENLRWNGHRRNTRFGLLLKFQGDELARQAQYKAATDSYQQAIMQFDIDFKENDVVKNPSEFSGVFSYINLFNTLAAKADAFEKQYGQEKNSSLLQASLDAYRAAFQLADHVENTYDSDESRLFLGKIKYVVHNRPIHTSLRLYELTHKKNYLEDAYFFDQRNKASLLTLTIRENELKKQKGVANELSQQESTLKMNITRLLLKSANTGDSTQLRQFSATIRDNEIELGKLREKINDDPTRQQAGYIHQVPSIHELQKKLDNSTAILSYHLSENELLVLLITTNLFEYQVTPIDKYFFSDIENFKARLQVSPTEERYSGQELATGLYKQLISPVQSKLTQVKRLVIIPDDELHYLPFEALQDENKKYLVERFSVQYQYATALLGKSERKKWPPGILSFAPFISKGYTDSSGERLNSLPASREETEGLAGSGFTDSAATKANFLRSVNHYGIVHLATHASVNNEDPSRSFISFYPATNDNKLYAQEIYGLVLDSTQLVILSACETGTGKLVKGEGLMSLSRAFAYAGCPNIVTSLWKSEDRSTAYITRRLHYYLEKKYSSDMALQQAKLDFLNSPDTDPALRSPNYWAHLVFIGNYEKRQSASNWWWVASVIIVGAVAYKFMKRKA
ncbi:MAG: CHAT domain-containing tetratricopeptide repeat protein [Chitinophagaceae bacterium]